MKYKTNIFICFAAEDRYNIAEPLVYHLKNYGIDIWYDRYNLLIGDNRIKKNLVEGAGQCTYAAVVISKNTINSPCTIEELSIIKERYFKKEVTVFPILYEISPNEIPTELEWIKEIIFKEVDRSSGTRDICNHIACKLTEDLLTEYELNSFPLLLHSKIIPKDIKEILKSYRSIDSHNLNSRISLLYAAHIVLKGKLKNSESVPQMLLKTFERLFTETKLNITIDYREIWLLENIICLISNYYIEYLTESSISSTTSNNELTFV